MNLPLPQPGLVGVMRTTSEFLKQRAGSATPQDLVRYLRAAPKVPPIEGDAAG